MFVSVESKGWGYRNSDGSLTLGSLVPDSEAIFVQPGIYQVSPLSPGVYRHISSRSVSGSEGKHTDLEFSRC